MTFRMGARPAKEDLEAAQAYSLTVLNENSQLQQFAMFQTIPNIVGPSSDPLSLAWMLGTAAPGSPSNPSQSSFSWQIDYSANTGYVQDIGTTTDPRRFTTASNIGVAIDSDNMLDVTYLGTFPNGAPAFPSNPSSGTTGEIQVQADGKIPTHAETQSQNMTINVGIGMNNKPTVVVELLPNLLYQFTPKPTYYIISGSFVEGQVIDTAISSAAYKVVFDGVTTKTLKFTANNQFEPA
ncbi:hypothetical protein [Stappia sp. ES.058]|uniref:hypothetical protein n=1 Tax=Stappia sp. ES.058 TaxID=1881061 RepID=UPI00087AE114|nr:hypothetical protein [Stappia sp. ES.058]SDT91604.1 hypothetical protein SAMN05428979_0367 [Stappia sp. ES.058]